MIVISETASGKTTQIPQFIYRDGLNHGGRIAITQVIKQKLLDNRIPVSDFGWNSPKSYAQKRSISLFYALKSAI